MSIKTSSTSAEILTKRIEAANGHAKRAQECAEQAATIAAHFQAIAQAYQLRADQAAASAASAAQHAQDCANLAHQARQAATLDEYNDLALANFQEMQRAHLCADNAASQLAPLKR